MVERTYYMDNLQGTKNGKDGEYDTVPIIIPRYADTSILLVA